MKLRYIILLGLFLFFTFGCTLKKPVYYGCCNIDNTDPTNPVCNNLSRTDTSVVNFVRSNFCNSTDEVCNVTLRLLTGPDRSDFTANLPYCTQASSSCIGGDCTAQVCGIYKYDPSGRISYSDSVRFSSDSGSTRILGDAPPSGLYGRSCLLIDANTDLDNFMKNSKGSFINSLRFGFGSDFAEFEKFRLQFPSSDAFCNINPDSSAKDRYQNYMLSPSDSFAWLAGRSAATILAPISTYLYCPQSDASPFFSTTYDSGEFPNYRYYPVTYAQFAVNYTGRYNSASGSFGSTDQTLFVNRTGSYSFSEFDKKFYQANLPLVYYTQIRDSYLGASSLPRSAPFECSSALDCRSSLCNFQDYYRGVCRTTAGSWVDCGCDSQSLQCLGLNSSFNATSFGYPNSPEVVQNYIDAYLQNGTSFYNKQDLGVYVVQARIDPDCDSGVLDGIDSPDCSDRGETCLNFGGAVIESSPNFPSGVHFFGETREGFIGYSLMRQDEFLQTNFAVNCNLRPGIDYTILEAEGFEGPTREDNMNQNDVNAIMATGAIFHGPSSIPRSRGYFMSQPPRCVTVGDEGASDLGYYTYVPHYIMIRSTGICQMNSRSLPVSYGFGWCEGCSYSTIAKQTLFTNLSNNYSTLAQTYATSSYSRSNVSNYVCLLNESAIIPQFTSSAFNPTPTFSPSNLVALRINETLFQENSDIFNNRFRAMHLTCPMIYQTDNPSQNYAFNSSNSVPDSAYINLKQKQFLDQGILPVLDLSDNSNWFSNGSLALKNGITNDAPTILIVSNFTLTSPLSSIEAKVDGAKQACPKCMISLRVTHAGEHGTSASIRWALDRVAVDRLNQSTSLFGKVDVISYQFFPDELLSERSSLCTAPSTTRNEEVFAFMENMSKTYLYRYVQNNDRFKLSLIPEFNFAPSCLDAENVTSLYSYIFSKSERLSKAGLIGLIYSSPPSQTYSSNSFTPGFCALSVGTKNLHLADPISVFTKRYATENATCVPCSDFDILSGKCSRSCQNGVSCSLSPTLEDEYTLDPSFPRLADGQIAVKCPPSTIANPCVPCSDRTESASCNFYLNDGSTFSQTFRINELNELTSDVIAALPSQYACCLADSRGENYTFVSAVDSARSSAPILFSRSNDPRQDCGVPQLSSLGPDMCGADTPFRNYRLECSVVR